MAEPSIDQLPPWGLLSTAYAGRGDAIPVPLQEDADRYKKLVRQLVAELSTSFWPSYDPATQRWTGAARDHAIALGLEDLGLMRGLSACLGDPVVGAGGKAASFDHRYFFEEEDGFKISDHPVNPKYPFCAWGESFGCYCEGISEVDAKALSKAFDGPGVIESGGLAVALKIDMQRPRPYQFALLMDRAPHVYETAYTADTPSMVSGHALQAMLSGCYVFKEHRDGLLADPRLREAWARFIVDVGDRRVFAGVHYPSDSMSSWYCALRAIDEFYPGTQAVQIKRFVWEAITRFSTVYSRVLTQSQQRGSVYPALLERLASLAQ